MNFRRSYTVYTFYILTERFSCKQLQIATICHCRCFIFKQVDTSKSRLQSSLIINALFHVDCNGDIMFISSTAIVWISVETASYAIGTTPAHPPFLYKYVYYVYCHLMFPFLDITDFYSFSSSIKYAGYEMDC